MQGKVFLASVINRVYDDGCDTLTRLILGRIGLDNWPLIEQCIQEWVSAGYIEILKDPKSALDDEPCIKVLKNIPWNTWDKSQP